MSSSSARAVALRALGEWRKGREFADALIRDLLGRSALSAQDKAFATELFYGVLRNRMLLSFWIDLLRNGRMDDDMRDVLSIGLYQLFYLHTPEHAALYETVRLVPKGQRGLINGVLRAALRRRDELLAQRESAPLAVRMSHPQFLIERWSENFGEAATVQLLQWNNQPPPLYARINRLKAAPDQFFGSLTEFKPLPGNPDFFRVDAVPVELLAQGLCYMQDPSTILACRLLNSQPEEKVLDACAAPGGKTGIIAEQMENRGTLVACDRDPTRLGRLSDNLKRLGVVAHLIQCDWTVRVEAAIADFGPFDRILIDAPCSNTGVMRRRSDVRWRLSPADFSRMQKEQVAIVTALVPLLKKGGAFVYSTCSLEPEENEQVVGCILTAFPNLQLVEQESILPFRDGFDGAFAAKFSNSASPTSRTFASAAAGGIITAYARRPF